MNKKILGAFIAGTFSGIGAVVAIKTVKLCRERKSIDNKKEKNKKVKIKGIDNSGLEITIEPRCLVTNVFFVAKSQTGRN